MPPSSGNVIASAAKQSRAAPLCSTRLLLRCAPRNDTLFSRRAGLVIRCYTSRQFARWRYPMSDNREPKITVIRETERPVVPFTGGATYRPIVGDDTGEGLPIRTGIQTSPPGYCTAVHSHPYVETLMVLEGRGEVWLDGKAERIAMEPGGTVVLPANRPHVFRVVGDQPLVTFGIHT